MIRSITRATCDECGKVEEDGKGYIGHIPFFDWLNLKYHKDLDVEFGLANLGYKTQTVEASFCGVECLKQYTNKLK